MAFIEDATFDPYHFHQAFDCVRACHLSNDDIQCNGFLKVSQVDVDRESEEVDELTEA